MSRLKSNPNIDLSKLHLTGLSFKVLENGAISIFDEKADEVNELSVKEKGWRKVISGTLFGKNTVRIDAIGKRPMHKSIINTLLESKDRSSSRSIVINGKKIGVLKECYGLKSSYWVKSLPYHHELKNWETLYYEKTTKDVQIYYRGKLFAAAKYYKGIYLFLILKDGYVPLCLGLALAAIDGEDNRYARFGK